MREASGLALGLPKTDRFIQLLTDAERRFIPLEVSIELTSRCNYRCQHCYLTDHKAPDKLSTERIEHLMKELAGMGCLFLTFTGGEVFLRPDWKQLSRYARKLGFSLRIFSNASLIDSEIAAELQRHKIAVEVSLYSMRAEVFDRITGRDGAFLRTMKGIRRLVEASIELKLKMPVMQNNLGCIQDVLRFADEINAELLTDPRVFHMRDGSGSSKKYEIQHADLKTYFSNSTSLDIAALLDVEESSPNQPLCAAGTRMAHISALGEVRSCSFFPEPVGNITQQSFKKIWQQSPQLSEIRKLRRSHLKECASCPRLSYCRRCFAQALVEDHNLLGPSRWSCECARAIEESVLSTELTS